MIYLDISKPLLEQMFCEGLPGYWFRVVRGLPNGLTLVGVEYIPMPPTVRLSFDDGHSDLVSQADVHYERLIREEVKNDATHAAD